MKKSLVALAALAAMGENGFASTRREFDADAGHMARVADGGGLFANIDSATLNLNRYMQAFGEADLVTGSIAVAANPTAADVIRVMKIPAGSEVGALMIGNGGLDTNGSQTLVVSIGYAPVDGVSPAASAAYFSAAGDGVLKSANAGKLYCNFAPITFEKDVYLTMTVGTASATFAAGTVYAAAIAKARGVK